MEFRELIDLASQRNLTEEEACSAMELMADGVPTSEEIALFLKTDALSLETVDAPTLAGLVRVVRSRAVPLVEFKSAPLIDTCGTGGGASTFNISTASALCLGAIRRVAGSDSAFSKMAVTKHGNRAIASKSGSADVLEELGVKIELEPEKMAEAIDSIGFGFLFAPRYHRAFSHVQPVRKKLAEEGLRTAFNFVGPLANPARPQFQVLGVFMGSKLKLISDVLERLGVTGALCVSGVTETGEPVDEFSICGETKAILLKDGNQTELTITPEDFGLTRADIRSLAVDSPEASAKLIRRILEGKEKNTPAESVVIMNTAAALHLAGESDWKTSAELAREVIRANAGAELLEEFVTFTSNNG